MSKLADKFWDDAFACMKTYPIKGVVSGDEIKALFDRHLAPPLALMERLGEAAKGVADATNLSEQNAAMRVVRAALTDYKAWEKERG